MVNSLVVYEEQNTSRVASVNDSSILLHETRTMPCRHEFNSPEWERVTATDVKRVTLLCAFALTVSYQFVNADDRAIVSVGDVNSVAKMVAVTVSDNYGVNFQVLWLSRSLWVSRQEGINDNRVGFR